MKQIKQARHCRNQVRRSTDEADNKINRPRGAPLAFVLVFSQEVVHVVQTLQSFKSPFTAQRQPISAEQLPISAQMC